MSKAVELARVSNRADVVTALSRQIVVRLQKLSYVQQGCARQDIPPVCVIGDMLCEGEEETQIRARGLRPAPRRCKDHAGKRVKACGIY